YLLSSGRHLQVLQFSRNPVYNASAEKFTTENFTKYDSTVVLNSESHITIVHRNKYYCIYFQPPIDIQNCSEKTQKCEAIILDYTGKSSYLDPDNKSTLKHQSFFSLNRKKSFYSMLYEMDSN